MNEASLIGLLIATVSFGALLYLAALGELIAEKAGVLNLGVEGMMAIGAVTAFIAGVEFQNPWLALLIAMLSGALLASIHGLFTVGLGAEQVVSGLALTILGLGLATGLHDRRHDTRLSGPVRSARRGVRIPLRHAARPRREMGRGRELFERVALRAYPFRRRRRRLFL